MVYQWIVFYIFEYSNLGTDCTTYISYCINSIFQNLNVCETELNKYPLCKSPQLPPRIFGTQHSVSSAKSNHIGRNGFIRPNAYYSDFLFWSRGFGGSQELSWILLSFKKTPQWLLYAKFEASKKSVNKNVDISNIFLLPIDFCTDSKKNKKLIEPWGKSNSISQ